MGWCDAVLLVLLAATCCSAKYVRNYAGLTSIPDDIPPYETWVELSGNSISSINGELDHLSYLSLIFLSYNDFTTFPNLTTVKDTIYSLSLTGNHITNFTGVFEDFPSLTYLSLGPGKEMMTEFPDISPLADTLKEFSISGDFFTPNFFISDFGVVDLTMMNQLVSFYVSRAVELTTFPRFGLNNSLKSLYLCETKIANITEDDIYPLQKLERLTIDEAHELSTFPRFRMNNSLRYLYLDETNIEYIQPEDFYPLQKLESLSISECPITDDFFPVISLVANSIQYIDLYKNSRLFNMVLSGDFRVLQTIRFTYTSTSYELPTFNGTFPMLSVLDLTSNDHSFMSSSQKLENLTSLEYLYLNYNGFSVIPNMTQQLKTLKLIDMAENPIWRLNRAEMKMIDGLNVRLRDTQNLYYLAPICFTKPTTLSLSGSHLDLCACKNFWLKREADKGLLDLYVSYVRCGDSDKFWYQMAQDEFLQVWRGSQQQREWRCDKVFISSEAIEIACSTIEGIELLDMSIFECSWECTRTNDCYMMSFLPTGGSTTRGRCLLQVPPVNGTVKYHNTAGWQHYPVEYGYCG